MRTSLALGLACLVSPALGWGLFGHQITATIAQVYLLPSTHKAICDILPGTYKCNLAGVAAWPDDVKQDDAYKKYSKLHYVNPKGDDPPKKCVFGDSGWDDEQNILKAIVDMSRNVRYTDKPSVDRDHALRFLVHFLGDLHQPLHLTGKLKGGNDVKVHWKRDDKGTDLHAVWDNDFVNYQVLFINGSQYTNVLPTTPSLHVPASEAARNQRIETPLKGSNYDAYIRYILLEGVYRRWTKDAKQWSSCPHRDMDLGTGVQSVLDDVSPQFQDPTDLPMVCPQYWASQTHPLLCTPIWPAQPQDKSLPVLSEEYADSVRDAMIVEKQLALGGVRLAAVLNGLLGSEEDKAAYGIVPMFE